MNLPLPLLMDKPYEHGSNQHLRQVKHNLDELEKKLTGEPTKKELWYRDTTKELVNLLGADDIVDGCPACQEVQFGGLPEYHDDDCVIGEIKEKDWYDE